MMDALSRPEWSALRKRSSERRPGTPKYRAPNRKERGLPELTSKDRADRERHLRGLDRAALVALLVAGYKIGEACGDWPKERLVARLLLIEYGGGDGQSDAGALRAEGEPGQLPE